MTRIEASHARPSFVTRSPLASFALGAFLALTPVGLATASGPQVSAEQTAFVEGQMSRIGSHPYLSKIVLEKVTPEADFVFLVQKDPAAPAGAPERLAKKHVAWMKIVAARFEEQVVVPGHLERSRGGAPHVVIVLTSDGDYRNYLNQTTGACPSYSGANYDPFLSATVLYAKSFSKRTTAKGRLEDQKHAFTHSMQQAYGATGFRLPGPEWLAEGMAVLGSMESWNAVAPEGGRHLPAPFLKRLIQMEEAGFHSKGALRTVRDLLRLEKRKAFRGPIRGSQNQYWSQVAALSQQCGALIFFLSEAEGGKRRAALQLFSADAIARGGGGLAAATEAFGDLDALDAEFWAYLHAEYKKVLPTHVTKARPADSPAKGPAEAEPVAVAFDPTSLALGPEDVEARFGLALFDAHEGRLAAAAAQLETLATEANHARARREHGRVVALLEARSRFIEHLVKTQGTLRVKLDGEKLSAGVAGLEEGVLRLEKNRRGMTRLPVERVGLVEWALAIAKVDGDFGTPLTLAYAYALEEDDRLKKKLRRVGDDGGLKRDAASLGSHIAVGTLAHHVRTCAEMSTTSLTQGEAEALVAGLKQLSPFLESTPFLARRRAGLQAAGALAYSLLAREMSLEELLRGRVERLEAGRLRITYDFEDEAQLKDFERDDDYFPKYRKSWPDLGEQKGTRHCVVQGGDLVSIGEVCLRFPLEFVGPQSVSIRLRVGHKGQTAPAPKNTFIVGLCDDRKTNMVASLGFGVVFVRDLPTGHHASDSDGDHSYFVGEYTDLVLDHDGSEVTYYRDGNKQKPVPVGARRSGYPVLMLHSDGELALTRIVLEGAVVDGALGQLRLARAAALSDALFAATAD